MKFLVTLFFLASSAQAAQINLDCHDENQVKMASVYTPTFVYSTTHIKADLELNGNRVNFDVILTPSLELPGVHVAESGELTVVGIAKTSLFSPNAKMQLDFMEHGLSVLTLTCKTTVHNPAFPRE